MKDHRDFKIFLALFLIFSLFLARAQEQITLTTYYPAPYGVYVELRSKRVAAGSTWFQPSAFPGGVLLTTTSLWRWKATWVSALMRHRRRCTFRRCPTAGRFFWWVIWPLAGLIRW